MKIYLWMAMLAALFAGCTWPDENGRRPYHNAYHQPLVSPGTKFATLPPTVQKTIRAESGTQEIDNIVKDARQERIVYRVHFRNYELFPPLYVAQDGSVLNPDLTVAIAPPRNPIGMVTGGTAIALSELSLEVIRAIQERAPRAEIASITKESYGVQTAYVVTFKDRRYPSLRITADGTVIEEDVE
jgi:hypothetical protein